MDFPKRKLCQHLSRALFVFLYGAILSIPNFGLDRDRAISQFHHTAWTAKDGAPSQTTALAQTTDGYLWIGSERGLYRFDGLLFEEYVPPIGANLPSHAISSLMATPDGGLWISFAPSGIGFLKDGQFIVFSEPAEVYCFARDLDGRIWAGKQSGLMLYDGSNWLDVGTAWNFTNTRIWTMFVDRNGTLWVATDDTLVFLNKGSNSFQQTGIKTAGIPKIDESSDGRIWIAEHSRPVRPIALSEQNSVSDKPEIRIKDIRLLGFDREGSLWMSVRGDGIRRVRFPERLGSRKVESNDTEVESYKVENGLSDNTAINFLEDREGNIWVGSNKGLDRFRHSQLVPVQLPPGYRDLTLLPDENGQVWVASAALKPMLNIDGENIRKSSDPMEIASVCRDANGVAWWGGQGGVWRQSKDQFVFFPEPRGTTFDDLDWMWEVVPDNLGDGLWVGLGDVGLMSFRNGNWKSSPKPVGLVDRVPSASFQDAAKRIWLGYSGNRVTLVDGERVQNYTQNDGIEIGRIRVIRAGGDAMWLGGDLGLARYKNGQFTTVHTASGSGFGTVSGIAETPDGALWLNELHGVVRISPESSRKLDDDPNEPVNYQIFDFADGLPGAPQMNFRSSTAAAGTDGRLWFATDNGLAWTDPGRMSKNTAVPPIVIRSLDTDRKKYDTMGPISLPSETTALKIQYTALSLSIPERVHFKYRLEGTGEDWQDAGASRVAVYNNLGPGDYRFQVIAANNDGVWNETGASLNFRITPAWYQTLLFRFIALVLLILAAFLLYRMRVRRIGRALNARFDERLAERTRLAQELHDTFLQTIQGSKMVADDALEQDVDPDRLRRSMEQLSTWLGQAVNEGRAALNSLRTSTVETNDLAQALRRATETCVIDGSIDATFAVDGDAKEMHPIVRDEIYRIGYEAIRNACAHSEASNLDVQLIYHKDLIIRVNDNGIGIDPIIAAEGKEGHFGLKGMRERTERIGADLDLVTSPSNGTQITLTVPGDIAFRTSIHTTD